MKYLLDASSLMLLLKKAEINSAVQFLQDSLVLDLTFYELGNSIWKEGALTKFLTPKEAEKMASKAQIILGNIDQATNEPKDFQKILEIAQTEKLSYYDSSYIYFAKERKMQLITEDKALRTKARKYVSADPVSCLLLL
jgi:predicted nucleic acid-binding protein